MTAIEKLQMLIEAAEYLDRRERGKDVLRHMKIIFCMHKLILTLLLGFLSAIKQSNFAATCYLLSECMFFFTVVMTFGEVTTLETVLISTHALVFISPPPPPRDKTQAHVAYIYFLMMHVCVQMWNCNAFLFLHCCWFTVEGVLVHPPPPPLPSICCGSSYWVYSSSDDIIHPKA